MKPAIFNCSYDLNGNLLSKSLSDTHKHNLMCACYGFLSYRFEELIFVKSVSLTHEIYLNYPKLNITTSNGEFELIFNFAFTELAMISKNGKEVILKTNSDNMLDIINKFIDYYNSTLN